MSGYWPWWAGAISLGLITVGYAMWAGRSLGVSGAWDRVVHWGRERRVERANSEFADESALLVALVAATREEFGDQMPRSAVVDGPLPGRPGGGSRPPEPDPNPAVRPQPVLCQAVLLTSIFLGGLLAAITSGRFQWRADMGPGFSSIVTANPQVMIVLLFVGGVLVGFGTRLAGGCSSGHGLSGCSRLQRASMLATAVFFGTSVAVSLLLEKVV